MSSCLIPDDSLPQALSLLSVERMGAYTGITADLRHAFELHDQMLRTAASLMPVAALIEISLRNAICEKLAKHFDTADWLQGPPPPFEWRGQEKKAIRDAKRHAQQAVYAKLSQYQKRQLDSLAFPDGLPAGLSHEDRVRRRRTQIQVTFGQLVAQLTLRFWKRLFSQDYQAKLWDRSLKRLFPDKSFERASVAEILETIYQSRNRVAHHEQLLGARLEDALHAIDQFVMNFGPKQADGTTLIEKMTQPHRQVLTKDAAMLLENVARFTLTAHNTHD